MNKLWLFLFAVLPLCVLAQTTATQKYVVQKGENLYSIARAAGITPRQLCDINSGITLKTKLKYGQRILLPAAAANAVTAAVDEMPVKVEAPALAKPVATTTTTYVVQKGETLYAIARKLGTTVGELKTLNQLTDLNVKAGQRIKVQSSTGAVALAAASKPASPKIFSHPVEEAATDATAADHSRESNFYDEETVINARNNAKVVKPLSPVAQVAPDKYEDTFNEFSASGFKAETFRGKAALISKNDEPMEAFYNGLSPGTLVRVTNMLNRKTVVVKVAGELSASAQKSGCLLVLSKDAAQKIEAAEENFLVEVNGFKL